MVSKHQTPQIEVRNLKLSYGSNTIMRDLNFAVQRGEILAVAGESGCGKSTLLKYLIGLYKPSKGKGEIYYQGKAFSSAERDEHKAFLRRFGVLYQGGALWGDMTLEENVSLPLEVYTSLPAKDIRAIVSLKLALVGLKGCEPLYPSQISGGMCKRAGLARALALDPEVLFFDEPSAGLDPISSRRLDELILQIRDGMGTTVILVSHELASIFAIADNLLYLDTETKTMLAYDDPKKLKESGEAKIRRFLNRGCSEKNE